MIDVDAVLKQVRSTADQVSTVVQVVFWFSLAAGVLVLLAAVSASQDERLLEGGVMRVLGGSRRQLRLAQASEFAAIGLLSGLVAAIAASVLSGVIAEQVFDLPWKAELVAGRDRWRTRHAGRAGRRHVRHAAGAGCAAVGDVARAAGVVRGPAALRSPARARNQAEHREGERNLKRGVPTAIRSRLPKANLRGMSEFAAADQLRAIAARKGWMTGPGG